MSSRRFKDQIRDMGNSSSALMKLRPVTFLYKPEYDKGQRTLQYGLIAEEVAEVYQDLVVYASDGKPYTVKYQYLTTMLLNEVQKQYRRAEAEAEIITSQGQKIEEEQRLSRLEKLVTNQEMEWLTNSRRWLDRGKELAQFFLCWLLLYPVHGQKADGELILFVPLYIHVTTSQYAYLLGISHFLATSQAVTSPHIRHD